MAEKKNGWLRIDENEINNLEAFAKDYIPFLSTSKTEREFHDNAIACLKKAGFAALKPGERLQPGARVYRSHKGKALFAAIIGSEPLSEGCRILGAHIDSPRLDAKPNPLYEEEELAMLDTHYYGGIRKYQWVSLPLAIHGVVVKDSGEKITVSIGEEPGDPVFVITDLLPHLAKEQIKKTLDEGITGEGLNVLLGSRPVPGTKDSGEKEKKPVRTALLNILKEKYGITEEDLSSAELEIVPAGSARELGLDRSMILGYGHDDRCCSYCCLRALTDGPAAPEKTAVLLLADKEEIGSTGATGMDSTFLENSLAELAYAASEAPSWMNLRRTLENSKALSADVSVCRDPNYPEVNSPNNTGQMNYGMVISKYTGSRGKYATSEGSAEFMADLRKIFNTNDILWQVGELGKVDLGGGGTIAKFLARYGMDVMDCGPAVLSMHGPWEAISKLDLYMSYKGYREFLLN